MSSLIRRYRNLGLVAVLAAAAIAALLATPEPGWGDDRDLLVSGLKKPYLFIILDSSTSMNLKIGEDPQGEDEPAIGYGDDPESRIYAAKEALYKVFSGRDDVHFGFATFDQDELRVVNKHWVYPVTQTVLDGLYDEIPPWPISSWPVADPEDHPLVIPPNGPELDCDGDGIDDRGSTKCYTGDALVFGVAAAGVPVDASAGTCEDPIDLDEERDRLNALPRPAAGNTTEIWVSDAGIIYRVSFFSSGTPGDQTLTVEFTAEPWDLTNSWPDDCDLDETDILLTGVTVTTDMVLDPYLNEFLMVDNPGPDPDAPENTAGHWLVADATSTATCSNPLPFTGQGWESNYDSGTLIGDTSFDTEVTNEDPYCDPDADFDRGVPTGIPDATDYNECVELRPMRPTQLSTLGRFADTGDMMPFDWDDSNKNEFLARLAPNHLLGGEPDFAVAPHLSDTMSLGVDNSGDPLSLVPKISGRPPIIAAGVTPLGKSMLDFRCWYTGNTAPGQQGQPQNVPKCDDPTETPFYEDAGWAGAACQRDPEFGCRRPYLILITDGFDTCAGESPVADISDLKNKLGLQTWALNLGDPQHCQSGGQGNMLHSVTTAGTLPGGPPACINVEDKEDLLNALGNIAETIAASAQAFAAAAVPTVQSNANQRIFLSSFRAVPDRSFWDGHLSSFWKPLPVKEETIAPDQVIVVPDTADEFCQESDAPDPNPTPGDGCHLWDAGKVLVDDQHDALDPLDPIDPDRRRVFYSRQTTNGNWPTTRRLLDPTSGDGGAPNDSLRYDLWRAFGLIPPDTPNDDPAFQSEEDDLEALANDIIAETLALKTGTLSDGTVVNYLLGDIFHSRPGLIEAPPNTRFFAENAGAGAGTQCVEDETVGTFDTGYRCFLERQLRRRRVLLVGADDGMLHAFDAGTYFPGAAGIVNDDGMTCDPGDGPGSADPPNSACGTGREIWAYMPREVMPTVRELVDIDSHQFTVDASPSIGDVFIDPLHNGTPTATDRRWRTVAITGLREGGSGYFALDVTQPEPIVDVDADPTNGRDFVPAVDFSANPDDAAVAECSKVPTPAGCGPVPYPAALWEFGDTTADSFIDPPLPPFPVRMDEDGNGAPDLGDTWSIVDIGRIRICGGAVCNPTTAGNNVVDRYVAIFTGGMDTLNKYYDPRSDSDPGIRGNWLYMVDIETGKIIYKRQLDHAAPSSPAAVDTNQDGYINRIYLTTLGGSLYRVDLDPDSFGNLPVLTEVDGLTDVNGDPYDDVERITVDSNNVLTWVPRKIFDANFNDTVNGLMLTTEPRPLYFPPSVFFVTELGLYGVAFGSGDREDLWARTLEGTELQQGRFYLFVDDTDQLPPASPPLNEGDFQLIDLLNPPAVNLLSTRPPGEKGWYLALEEQERVSAQAFNLLGVTFFSSFVADTATSDPDGNRVEATCRVDDITSGLTCAKSGSSKVFVTSTVNARPFVTDPDTAEPFFRIAGAFVSEPFTEIGYTSGGEGGDPGDPGDPGGGGKGGGGGGGGGPVDDDLTDDERAVMEALRDLFPDNCRFTNQRIDVRLVTSDTQVRRIAAVPVCVIEKNWKEF